MTKTVIRNDGDEIKPPIQPEEASLRRQILKQQNQIAVALAYLRAGQPHLATMVLEGMDP